MFHLQAVWGICYDSDYLTQKSLCESSGGFRVPSVKTAITVTRPESYSDYFLQMSRKFWMGFFSAPRIFTVRKDLPN